MGYKPTAVNQPFDLRLRPDKVGSACSPLRLGPYVTVRPAPVAREGAAIACRVLSTRSDYGHLELPSGRKAPLGIGDIIVGVLGNRAALRGFCGRVPETLEEGDTIHLLNQGGVVGVAEGGHAGLGDPIRLQVLGTPIRGGQPLLLQDHGIADPGPIPDGPPIIVVVGTCMHAGKTTAAAVLTKFLRRSGRVVHAGKVTGVASLADLHMFADHGASQTLSFLDCGVPSTCYRTDVPAIARTLLSALAAESPDVILLEMGDGLMGEYGVDEVLADSELAARFHGAILAANDPVGAVAGAQRLRGFGIEPLVIIGPATDNAAGTRRLGEYGLEAANVLVAPDRFCALATAGLFE